MSQSPWSTVITSDPDVPAHDPRRLGQRLAQIRTGIGRPVRGGLLGRGEVAQRPRTWRAFRGPAATASSSHSVCRDRSRPSSVSYWSWPGNSTSSTSEADITGSVPYKDAGTAPEPRLKPWRGESPGRCPRRRLSQPSRVRGAGVGVLDLLHCGEVRAVRGGQARRVHRSQATRVPQREQWRQLGMETEHAVLAQQPVRGHRDPGPSLVVDRVCVGDHQREAVAGSAQREDHQDRAGRGGRRGGGGEHRGAAPSCSARRARRRLRAGLGG